MIQQFRQTDSGSGFLFHYTSVDTACNYILKSKQLLLNSFHNANDPQDAKDWFLSPFTKDHEKYDLEHAIEVSKQLKRSIRMTCFTQELVQFTSGVPIQDINRCGFCNPQMWHYYGDKNRGVCLVFDKQELLTNFSKQYGHDIKYNSVSYEDRPLGYTNALPDYQYSPELFDDLGVLNYCKRDILATKKADSLIFQKSAAWHTEAEFRLVTVADENQKLFLDIEQSLKMICLGPYVRENTIDTVYQSKQEAGLKGCSLGKLFWKNGSPFFVEGRHEIKRRSSEIIDFQ